ncbi:hypothetical protein OG21DRAFT_1466622 [Imleria badia]|nr:hypothetical protein OG21DRAFT_1466622 [Imleria badia]
MDGMRSTFSNRLIASLAVVSLARADYYIDDQNFTSLLYSENPGGAKWGPFQEGGETLSISLANGTMMTIDASQCFNYTYTYAACTVADDCQVQIPFTGSGITIYVLQAGAQGINASLTIDGGAPNYNVLPAPTGPNFYTPNVTLFSIQGMTTGNHTATMTVQNWENIFSGMMFDYAEINQTVVSATTTTTGSVAPSTALSITSIPTSTGTSSPSKSTTNVGAIVGGVVGGLGALVALLLALFYFRRRRPGAPRFSANLDAEPRIEPFFSADSLYPQGSQRQTVVTAVPTTESLVTGTVSAHAPPHSTSSGSSRREKSQLGITNPSMSQIARSNVTSPSQAGGLSSTYSPSEASRPRIQQTHPMLTDDQADFVNNLYTNNVPTAAIARVIERMIAGERQPAVDGYDSLPPPSYYHGTGDA